MCQVGFWPEPVTRFQREPNPVPCYVLNTYLGYELHSTTCEDVKQIPRRDYQNLLQLLCC